MNPRELVAVEDEEEKVIDVETVAGYKQIVAVWEARDVVDSVLGFRAWTRVFPVMCDRRLRPTPWLNKANSCSHQSIFYPSSLSYACWQTE